MFPLMITNSFKKHLQICLQHFLCSLQVQDVERKNERRNEERIMEGRKKEREKEGRREGRIKRKE